MLRLAIKLGDDKPIEFKITGARITIGRRHDNDFRIRDSFVSAYHAELIRLEGGGYELVDRKSFNGTFVNGRRVDRSEIKAGDAIKLGTVKGKILEGEDTWETVAVPPARRTPSWCP